MTDFYILNKDQEKAASNLDMLLRYNHIYAEKTTLIPSWMAFCYSNGYKEVQDPMENEQLFKAFVEKVVKQRCIDYTNEAGH